LDGVFSGETEEGAYAIALNYLEGQLTRAARTPAERAAITQRFNTYRQLIASQDCELQNRSTPYVNIIEGMYEELTQFIESDAFTRVRPPATQQALVALQAEVFSRLTQMGAPRRIPTPATGTEAEVPRGPFQAYQPILDSVVTAGPRAFIEGCGYNAGDAASDESALPVFYQAVGGITSGQPQPFEGDRDVNTDFRYSLHEVPSDLPVAQRDAVVDGRQQPSPETRRIDITISDDPIGGDIFGSDLEL
jgi:hypothetical protein